MALSYVASGMLICNAEQKSSGNGKDLLQIDVSTRWAGLNNIHSHAPRYDTCAVAQVGVTARQKWAAK